MKQIAIVMSLVFSVFVLSGCDGKDDDKNADKEACDKKGAGWVWDVVKEECIVDPTNKEDCKDKGEGWLWIEESGKCEQQVAELGDKEKCEAKGAGWIWNEDKATNAGEEYKKCTKDLSVDCTDPAKPLVKIASPLECAASYITIINSTNTQIDYSLSPGFTAAGGSLGPGKCRSKNSSVHEAHQGETGIGFSMIQGYVRDAASLGRAAKSVVKICEKNTPSPCPSSEGVYEVSAGRTGFVITKVNKTIEELREMGCFRRLIEAEGPL